MEPAWLAEPAGKDDIYRYGDRRPVHNLLVLFS
jgi:hypothetical protein